MTILKREYHNLLKRQLKKIFGEDFVIPKEWRGFISAVDNAYKEFDIDRKMLERSLELSSHELLQKNAESRAIFEAMPDLFFRIADDGTILDCKAGNTKDLYLSRERIIGSNFFNFPIEGVRERFRDAIGKVKKTSSMMVIEYDMEVNGEERSFEARIFPFQDQVIVIIRNVTQQKSAEHALRESEEKYRSIFENAVEGIFQTTTDGFYINANPSLAKMLGFDSVDELINSSYNIEEQHYVVPEDRLKFKKIIESQGQVNRFETQVYRKDKSKIWISINARKVSDSSGNTMFYEGTIENITNHKLVEEALFESEEKYRSIVEESQFGVFIIQDGLFRFVNNKFCEIHGYSADEVVDRLGPKDFLLPEDLQMVEEIMGKRHEGKNKSEEIFLRIRQKGGEIRQLRAIGGFVLYKGRPAIIGTTIDVTKEKALEQQLVQSQKMESVGRLAGGIAHDFNNMLGVILGNTQLAKMNISPVNKINEYLVSIENATTRAADFVKRLLAFSRQQVLELKVIDLNDVVKGFKKMVHRAIGEDIEMSFVTKPQLPKIKADAAQINQILLNLVVNARDAMPDGGELSVDIAPIKISEEYSMYNMEAKPGDYVIISVTDTGSGMDKNTLNKIFEPFFTTRKDGSGLGLSVVYGLVKQHKGFINVYSELGVGTTFNVYLPSVEDDIETTEEEDKKTIRGGNETILIVEDEEELREIASEMLSMLGYNVLLASNGEKGIDIFKEKADDIHLVIIDVVMPKIGGRETYEEMKKIKSSVRVLFVTGYSLDGIHTNFILEEGIDAIQKPYSLETIARKIREVLSKTI